MKTKNIFSIIIIALFINIQSYSQNYEWTKTIGGSSHDNGNFILPDNNGNIYVIGEFYGVADFDPDPSNVYNLTSNGIKDVFILKLDASQNFLWVKSFGGATSDYVFSAVWDNSQQNIYLSGKFSGTVDFDPNSNISNLTANGAADGFILKLDIAGNYVWATNVGGTSSDVVNSTKVDSNGDIISTGYYNGTVDFDNTSGIFNLTSSGQRDVFVQKLSSVGNFIWAKSFGGTTGDEGQTVNVDDNNDIYVTGYFNGTSDFEPGIGVTNLTSNGSYDIFINKLSSAGNFVWAKSFGGIYEEITFSATMKNNNLYTVGYFIGSFDFDPNSGTDIHASNAGSLDMFIHKINASGDYVWTKTIGSSGSEIPRFITSDLNEDIYIYNWIF